jgi:hypothetical protein
MAEGCLKNSIITMSKQQVKNNKTEIRCRSHFNEWNPQGKQKQGHLKEKWRQRPMKEMRTYLTGEAPNRTAKTAESGRRQCRP